MAEFQEELKTAADACVEHLVEVMEERPPGRIVYHYTDSAGFVGILRDNKIRATDAHFLNDPLELSHVLHVLDEAIKDGEFGGEYPKTTAFISEVLVPDRFRGRTAFVASFTTRFDDLSQWRAYASDGAGYALGFWVEEQPFALVPGDRYVPAPWARVLYSTEDKAAFLKKLLEPLMTFLEGKGDLGLRDTLLARAAIAGVLSVSGALMKQDGFRAEDEWRVLVPGVDIDPRLHIQVRASANGAVPYVEVSTLAGTPLPLADVLLGPRLGERDVDGAMLVLEKYRYEPLAMTPGGSPEGVIEAHDKGFTPIRRSGIRYGT